VTARADEARLLDEAIDAYLGLGPAPDDARPDPELAATARLLADVMPRFHPRFGFEERLAHRLSAGGSWVATERASGSPDRGVIQAATPMPAIVEPSRPRSWRGRRALLRGGVLASGVALASGVSIALPLAGAALVRRRRARAAGRAPGVV
jgi:hypothetical protein